MLNPAAEAPLPSDRPTSVERLAVVGTGTIACGLAVTASRRGDVWLRARSQASAHRAATVVERMRARLGETADLAGRVHITTDLADLGDATAVVEAVVEDMATKMEVLREVAHIVSPAALVASTTSSLSVQRLADASGAPERFLGLHVFNPVTKMELVELVFAHQASPVTRERSVALCHALGKKPVVVPDTPGFVVNRLLFPYLFGAVTLLEDTGLEAAAVDDCMRLGAGHPMGPLQLLDLVGLDVAQAIGETIGAAVPASLTRLVAEGALGRKSGRGFYRYDPAA
jgi:3-hydroxybutyryl-CoA dehydrogenase